MSHDTPETPGPGSDRAQTVVRMHAIAAGLQGGGLEGICIAFNIRLMRASYK